MHNSKAFHITPLKKKDAVSLYSMMASNAERFAEFFPKTLAQNLNVEDSKEFIVRKTIENKNKIELTFALKESMSEKIIGIIILKELDMTERVGELAYAMDRKYSGKGWMSQAVKEFSAFAFNEIELKTLQIITHKSNIGSCKVAEKNGFIWQRTLKNGYTPTNGNPMDMEVYELSR